MTIRAIINTWDQLVAAGGGVGVFYRSEDRGRGGHGMGWTVIKVNADGSEAPTCPGAPWYDNKRKVWNVLRVSERAKARLEAIAWSEFYLGEIGPWVRNGFGDYVPKRINDAFPIERRP